MGKIAAGNGIATQTSSPSAFFEGGSNEILFIKPERSSYSNVRCLPLFTVLKNLDSLQFQVYLSRHCYYYLSEQPRLGSSAERLQKAEGLLVWVAMPLPAAILPIQAST